MEHTALVHPSSDSPHESNVFVVDGFLSCLKTKKVFHDVAKTVSHFSYSNSGIHTCKHVSAYVHVHTHTHFTTKHARGYQTVHEK